MRLDDLVDSSRDRIESYRSQHKTCILSILFCDIVGYSRLCEDYQDHEVNDLRHSFERTAIECVERANDGMVVKFLGDAVLGIFAEPFSAVHAALQIKGESAQLRIDDTPIKLRTGIHMGVVAIETKGVLPDVFGKHVNRTSRIQTAAMPGEILASEAIRENVEGFHVDGALFKPYFIRKRIITAKNIGKMNVYTVVDGEFLDDEPISPDTCFIRLKLQFTNPDEEEANQNTMIFNLGHNRSILIGRDQLCDIQIDAETVSRRHAIICYDQRQDKWILHDIQSTNLTVLNGEPISIADLKLDDKIKIAGYTITVDDFSTGLQDAPPGTKLLTQ